MDLEIDPQAVKGGFDAVKAALDTLKSLRELFRSDPAKHKEVGQQLELAERQLRLAEAQVAQALGYTLCRAHFPPVPMLKDRVEPQYVETIYRCPECHKEEPPPEYFSRKRAVDESFRLHNERVARQNDWLGS